MPAVLYDLSEAILRLGVSGAANPSMVMPFDIGGAGIITNEQPFDIEAPYVGVTNVQIFDIEGYVSVSSIQPFDIGQVTGLVSIQPFDIIGLYTTPGEGTNQPTPKIAFYTSLAQPVIAGSSTLVVASAAGITVGTTLYLQGDPAVMLLVTNVADTTLTVAQVIGASYQIGTTAAVGVVNATLSAPAAAGDTTVTLTTTTGVTIGTIVAITNATGASEFRTVIAVNGSVVTLAAPLGQSYGAGSGVAQSGPFLTGMLICDKAGNVLGAIND